MTDKEANKYITEVILGKCYHETRERTKEEREPIYGFFGGVKGFKHASCFKNCIKCGEEIMPCYFNGKLTVIGASPNYCSDEEDRSLLHEIVKKIAPPNSYSLFEDTLLEVIRQSHSKKDWGEYNNGYLTYLFINATAAQLARACVLTHMELVK